jgi:hypothetical protein
VRGDLSAAADDENCPARRCAPSLSAAPAVESKRLPVQAEAALAIFDSVDVSAYLM